MSISNANLLSAIRGLEDAVYFKDCRGRYASLPDNNSMRIDLLSSRITELAKMIEDSTGGDIPDNINKIVGYLDGSTDIKEFPHLYPSSDPSKPSDIIDVDTEDEGKYSTIQKALDELYKQRGGTGETKIEYDESKDGYVKYMNDGTVPDNYETDLLRYPNVFNYIYKELNYLFEYLFERENNLDVYEGMSVE